MVLRNSIHPTTFIIWSVSISVLLWRDIVWTVIVSLIFIWWLFDFEVSLKDLYRKTYGAVWLIFILMIVSLFSTGNVIWAMYTGYRFLLMILILSMMSMVMSTFDLTYGISILLSPLSLLKFPVSEIAFVMAMTLRFIPLMGEEVDRIIISQRVRGFDIRKFKHVISAGYSVLVPVFVSATLKSEAMAISLYLRGVDVKKGIPPVKEIRFKWIDVILLLFLLAMLVVSFYYA